MATLTGTVQSGTGGYPLPNVPVTVYEALNGPGIQVGGGRTDGQGRFSFPVTESQATTIFYAVANVTPQIVLMTVIGAGMPASIVINELTTVAAAFSMAQFANGAALEGGASALRTAAGMSGNLAAMATGQPSNVMLNPPNANQTNSLQSLCALGNLTAACIRQPDSIDTFFGLATPSGGNAPADTFQALLDIARNPANNAGPLFSQSQMSPSVFTPTLSEAPDAWTLCVKVNDTGSPDTFFGGPANIAFDQNGRAWIANNVFQGTPDSGNFIVVLNPDGTPAVPVEGSVASPVVGGGLKGPGWGITIDPDNHVWVGNFGWGTRKENYPHRGSVSEFALDGTPLSGDDGWTAEIHRVQATVSDGGGNIWMASYGNDRVVVYRGGDPGDVLYAHSGPHPFCVAIDADGNGWVTNGNGLGWPHANPATLTRFRINGTALEKTLDVSVGYATKVVVVDSRFHAWVASSGDGMVYRVNPQGDVVGTFDGGGIDAPWGLALDGDQNVWVANFGKLGIRYDYTRAALSVLAGDTEKTRDAGLRPGDPLSPGTGYTLKTGGDPVTLPDGEIIYTDGEACYSPLMRSTSCQIDRAGNVWVVNNWKPGFATDFDATGGDPGGDGVVIFVGLAKPVG